MMVRNFQSVIGKEARQQILEKESRLPDTLVACVGGGSNAAGLFFPFIEDNQVSMIGVEAAGYGLEPGRHAASLTRGEPGVLHGSMSYVLQDEDGQTLPVHSISAGLDYPGVGPEHSYWKDSQRVTYASVTDDEALEAFQFLAETEGIIPALEPSHALAHIKKIAGRMPADRIILMGLSGSGAKDAFEVARKLNFDLEVPA
jgi:tryptophan synthase beta chain